MKKSLALIVFLALLAGTGAYAQQTKPRVIVTTDGEVDDRSSFTRFLLYTSDVDLRGVIATNSKWQKKGHGLGWIHEAYELYGQVRDTLLLHKSGYPSVDYLESITALGNEDPEHLSGGAPYVDSEGSELILDELLKMEDDPLHITCWGGVNTVAHALWKFRKNYPQEYDDKISMVRVIAISFQDEAGEWIVENMPQVRIIRNNAFHMTWNYHSIDNPLPHNPHPHYMSEKWLNENIKTGHGPLGAWYPQDNVSEGDTPAFLGFIDNGLNAYRDYSLGGWGGRYQPINDNYWSDAKDDNNEHKTLWRWIPELQNDFAARMDWTVHSYEEANHAPVIDTVSSAKTVEPGQKVALQANGRDPDGDNLYYYWWHYPDPSGMDQAVKINKESSKNASFTVPEKSGDALHIILEVTDDGTPRLKRYRRLIFKVEN